MWECFGRGWADGLEGNAHGGVAQPGALAVGGEPVVARRPRSARGWTRTGRSRRVTASGLLSSARIGGGIAITVAASDVYAFFGVSDAFTNEFADQVGRCTLVEGVHFEVAQPGVCGGGGNPKNPVDAQGRSFSSRSVPPEGRHGDP